MESRLPASEPWWALAVGGVVSLLFGVVALAWPGLTLITLAWLFGFYALIYGIVELVATAKAIGARTTWWTHLMVGVVSVVAGLYVLAYPGVGSFILLFVIALWAIVVGIVEVVSGIGGANLRQVVTGVISILFGFLLFTNPVGGVLSLLLVIGIFAIVRGIILLFGAFRAPAGGAAPS